MLFTESYSGIHQVAGAILSFQANSNLCVRIMATYAVHTPDQSAAADDFQALEQRIFRTVELLRAERETRAAAEARVAELEAQKSGLEEQLHARGEDLQRLQDDLQHLHGERDQVRQRVERLLHHLDEFTA